MRPWRPVVKVELGVSESPGRAPSQAWQQLSMAHAQALRIEIQYLKDALVASQRKSDQYAQLGGFYRRKSKIIELIEVHSDSAL